MTFDLYDETTAPAGSKPALERARAAFGFLPNLLGVFAESPATLEGYMAVSEQFGASSLSGVEQQVVLLATSFENGCTYCVAAHSTVAGMVKMPADVLASLRDGNPISDPKLEALRTFTTRVVRERGWVGTEALQAFFDAGYDRAQAFEVILGVTQKTLSNYVNHIAETPLDEAFAPLRWSRPETADAS